GTGSISILFHSFPYGSDSQIMKLLSLAFFFLNLALFVLFTAVSAARYILFPDIWSRMLRHPVQSMYLGTFPMGATTLFAVSITVIHDIYNFGGRPLVYAIWALWWLDVAISVLCCWGIGHTMLVVSRGLITRQKHSFESMTLTWLLPVVTLVVGASTGGIIAQALIPYSLNSALLTLTFSACMVIIGLALTMMHLTVYLIHTIVYGYPKGPGILAVFFPLGPAGQSGYAILLIGSGFKSILPLAPGEIDGLLEGSSTGEIINVVCVVTAFALWSFGTMWMISAFLGLWHSLRRAQFPFRLTFWSMVFPNGVYANCTLALASTFGSSILRVWGGIYAVATLLLWVYVAAHTLHICPKAYKHFAPAWHLVIMGTGVTSSLIYNFPYGHGSPVIRIFTLIIFFLNFVLFIVISAATVARYAFFPDVWSKMLRHPAQSLFVGTAPMGFCTLINIAVNMNQETGFGGQGFLHFLWGCWWIDCIVSFFFSTMAAVWLIPVITLVVASSTGGLLSAALRSQSATLALLTTGVSFSTVIIGLSLAMMMTTVYLARLIVYGPPDANLILSAFVVLGPLGQGGYSQSGTPKFGLAYWGLIFPNGVYALLSVQLGTVLDSGFFRVFGAIWSCIVFLLWATISIRTIPALIDRSIFDAPCLAASLVSPSSSDPEKGGPNSCTSSQGFMQCSATSSVHNK
ncbi:voltage-dependent anion channel, partial [Boletus coccyginus]